MMMIKEAVQGVVDAVGGDEFRNVSSVGGGNRMVTLIVLVLYLVLLLLVGKWLWNNILCKVVTFCKPMPDVYTLLGLVVLLELVLPC